MGLSAWAYFGFTVALFLIFVGIILYYYTPARKGRVEKPKYVMLNDDEPNTEEVSHAGERRHTGKRS